MSRAALALALVAAFAFSPAAAKEAKFVTKAVADKPQPVVLAPDKAYVLVEAGKDGAWLTLMRVPDEAERAADEAERDAELAKAHGKWVKKLDAWQKARKVTPQSAGPRPVEPTLETFAWAPYEQRHVVSIGPLNRFAKGDASLYLQEVPPGRYVYYGNVMIVPNGAVTGTCACMGTVSFAAEAGKVTSLRVRSPFAELRDELPEGQRPRNPLDLPAGVTSLRLDSVSARAADPRIPADRVAAAALRPVPWMPNWYGLEIDRVMPVAGVFRYEGARQVDLTAPVTEASQAKPDERG